VIPSWCSDHPKHSVRRQRSEQLADRFVDLIVPSNGLISISLIENSAWRVKHLDRGEPFPFVPLIKNLKQIPHQEGTELISHDCPFRFETMLCTAGANASFVRNGQPEGFTSVWRAARSHRIADAAFVALRSAGMNVQFPMDSERPFRVRSRRRLAG
jgi:hypothetical protein